MASQPTLRPEPRSRTDFDADPDDAGAACRPSAPLLNRATDGPLSRRARRFKVVTAAAALDSGKFTPDSTFYDPGYCIEYGKQVSNAAPTRAGRSASARVNFAQALAALDQRGLLQHRQGARRRSDPRAREEVRLLRGPAARDARRTSARRAASTTSGKLFYPNDPTTQVDPGRLAFGQERLLVTPLQMAMVAAGDRERRRRDEAARRRPGRRRPTADGRHAHEAAASSSARCQPQTAAELNADDGRRSSAAAPARAAQIPGVTVAGKTGTAETGERRVNTTPGSSPSRRPTTRRSPSPSSLENQTRLRRHDRRADREAAHAGDPARSVERNLIARWPSPTR